MKKIIVMGDINISPTDLDIGIGEPNAKRWLRTGKCSFLPEGKRMAEYANKLGTNGYYRQLNPTKNDRFSWFGLSLKRV